MLNKMDKFDIFVPHPLTNTSFLIQLSPECGCKPLVCLLKRPVILSLDFQDRSIRNYSCYTFGGGAVKPRVKFKISFKIKKMFKKKKEKKEHLIDCVFKTFM